jgi:hypothetical protein
MASVVADPDSFWSKAKLFVNRALSAHDDDLIDEAIVWAAVSLELLGKAALCRINPTLVADPSDDGKSLLIAAGVSNDRSGFKTIQAKTVFSRCGRAFPSFDEREANLIAGNRNEELHSATSPSGHIHPDSWWERYWAQAAILVEGQGETIEGLVGSRRAAQVEQYLARNEVNVQRRVSTMIASVRQAFALSLQTGRVAKSPVATLTYEYEIETDCPSCELTGELYGDYVQESEVDYDPEGGYPQERLRVAAEEFLCPNCGLHLRGPDSLAAAELPSTFSIDQDFDPPWDDYGND